MVLSATLGTTFMCSLISHLVTRLTVIVPLQDGWTAMMFACQEGHEHVVEALLKGGATVDIQNEVTPVITWQ